MRDFDHDEFDRQTERIFRLALGAGCLYLILWAVIIVAAILAINKWLI